MTNGVKFARFSRDHSPNSLTSSMTQMSWENPSLPGH